MIDALVTSAYTFPLEKPGSDGTLCWDATTIVVVEAMAEGACGLGYSYGSRATAILIDDTLAKAVIGSDPMDVPRSWRSMVSAVRNLGRPGIASCAIAAVDGALWDLKARLLDLPLLTLLGRVRDSVEVYASGGFTSLAPPELEAQLAGWVELGMTRVKMKVGRTPAEDVGRVAAARAVIGADVELDVDANGAYRRREAIELAAAFTANDLDVRWFEEPVSSDDLEGLRLIRDRVDGAMEVAAGEYGYDLVYFRRMLRADAVDTLQADATRCAGITGFLQVGALCDAWSTPLSAHTAPSLHAHPGCSLAAVRHVEWFADHVEVERRLFDGALVPVGGRLVPDASSPGMGLALKRPDAAPFLSWSSQ